MIFRNFELLQSAVRKIQLLGNSGSDLSKLETRIKNLETATVVIANSRNDTPHQAVNIFKNGDIAHSVRTWNETSATDDDENKEAAFWFSHVEPIYDEEMLTDDARTILKNTTLKTAAHSCYNWDGNRCRWDREVGAAEMCAGATLDAPIDQPVFRSSFTAYLVLGRVALSNKNVAVPRGARLFAGLWAKQDGHWDWVKAANSLDFTAASSNLQTKEYRYRLHVRTDRGIQFLSDEITVLNAPATLGGNNYVQLRWSNLPNSGIISYDIYRYDPLAAQYVLLQQIGSGSSNYQDNGTITNIVGGYPTGDFDRGAAYSATPDNVLYDLARNGVADAWDTISFELTVASSFNLGTLESPIFGRIGITGLNANNNFDYRADDLVTTSGIATVTSADGFTIDQDGMNFRLYNPRDRATEITGTIHFIDTHTVSLSVAPNFTGSDGTLIIEGGGPEYGLYADLIHVSTTRGAVYAPNPEDYSSARKLLPASLPNGSTQGGAGVPSPIEGHPACVWEDENVWITVNGTHHKTPARELKLLDTVKSDGAGISQILELTPGVADVYTVETANGMRERCTLDECLITSFADDYGTRLANLSAGDTVLTMVDGRLSESRITRIFLFKLNQKVVTLTLSARPLFVAGGRVPQPVWKKIWPWLKNIFGYRREASGIVNHNRKQNEL